MEEAEGGGGSGVGAGEEEEEGRFTPRRRRARVSRVCGRCSHGHGRALACEPGARVEF